MKRLLLFPFFLALTMCARAGDLYQLQRLSEREMLQTYTRIMTDACHYADPVWKQSSFDSAAGYWGDGLNDGNQGIRAIGDMVFTSAVLLKYSGAFSEAERNSYLSKATAALRFAMATHLTGTQKCTNGKPWGGSWQSAMWAGTLGFGAWLIWDKLDSQLQKDVERVIASEADRFLTNKPPSGSFSDTKAEENAWNLTCISMAANMFPQHSHAAAWKEKAIEYAMNTLSAPQDRDNKTLVDGKPVNEWFAGENVHSDFTLENHGFFHPAYVACSSYMLTQIAMHFTFAHRSVPQAVMYHLLDVWKMYQTIILPCGEPAYVQGMDWELHGITLINLFASLASYQKDPLAARLEKNCLQYTRVWQEMENGNLAVPGSRLGFTRHAICAEQAAYGFLAHKIFGSPVKEISARKAAAQLTGINTYNFAEFVTHRTENKLASFSWKNKIMGMLVPIGEGHDGNPHFTPPIPNGFVGSFDLVPAGDAKIKVVEHSWKKMRNGFETSGTLLMNGGRLKQTLKVISIGEKTVIYQDRVRALTNVSVAAEHGVPLGIENDKITGGTRTLFHQNGETVFDFQKTQAPMAVSGSWANVDGRLGIVVVEGSGLSYAQATGYHPGMAVCADVLYGSSCGQLKNVKAGEEVAKRIVLLFAEISPKKTESLVKSFKIENKAGHRVLRFQLPEGGKAEVPLL